MSVTMNPYLNFAGNTREAMEFYQSIFGGDLAVSSFADFGMADMPTDGTMHAALTTPDFVIMASDAMPGAEATWGGTRNYISLGGTDAAQLRDWFERLAEGGNVGMALEPQVWGATFGICMDKYGIEWMVSINPSE